MKKRDAVGGPKSVREAHRGRATKGLGEIHAQPVNTVSRTHWEGQGKNTLIRFRGTREKARHYSRPTGGGI